MCPLCSLGIGDSRGSYGVGFARGASADAEKAREAGRELLLLELRPGPSGAPREGLLFATAKGELLAAVPLGVEEVGRDPPWAGDDLVARVARAYELTCAPPPR